jgi:hypothetical protein
VVVAEQHHVDGRQVAEAEAGRPQPLGSGEGERADAFAPHRVGEDVEALGLDEESGVVDERDAQFVAKYPFGRRRSGRGRLPHRPRTPVPAQHPPEHRGKAPGLGAAHVAEPAAVEVVAAGTGVPGRRKPVAEGDHAGQHQQQKDEEPDH